MSGSERKIIGYLFPIPQRFVDRVFSGKRDVFIKPLRYRFLTAGKTVVFYNSDLHAIVGEAKIKQIVCSSPSDIWKEYQSRIFLQKDEFDDYVAMSPLGPRARRKNMTAFVLRNVRKYPEPRKPPKRVTPSGYYLTE
jgi:hypothetical protein